MNCRSTGVWAHLSSLHRSNCNRSLRSKRKQTTVHRRCRSKWWMVKRPTIQILPIQYRILFSIQSRVSLNMSVLIGLSGRWIPVQFANRKQTKSLAPSIQFQTFLEQRFWCTKFGQYGWLWGDGVGIQICQECWWQIKWVLGRLLPHWQRLWYAICWLRRLLWGCCCQLYGRIPFESGRILHRMTIPGSLVLTGSGIRYRDWIQCLAAC